MNRILTLAFLSAALIVPASTATAAFAKTTTHAAKAHRAAANPRSRKVVRHSAASAQVRNPVTTAAAIAEGYWGSVPCGGQISVVADRPLAKGLDSATDGWVTFTSSLGPDNLSAPAASYRGCTISLAHWRWASWNAMESDWGMFCLTMVHEMGHLLGHKHSLVPGSVMAPVFTSDANVPAVCNRTWLPGRR
jgi:hypothetical protein